MKSQNKFILAFLLGISVMVLYSCRLGQRSANEERTKFDTTFFTGKNAAYPPDFKAAVMEAEAYKHYKLTSVADSVHIYLKQAEAEAKQKLNIKD